MVIKIHDIPLIDYITYNVVGPARSDGQWDRYIIKGSFSGKKCFEFSWSQGNGHFFVGFKNGDSIVKYYHNVGSPYFTEHYDNFTEINRYSIGIDSVIFPIMMCADSYQKAVFIIHNNVRYDFNPTYQGSKGKINPVLGEWASNSCSDTILFNFGQFEFTNKKPANYRSLINIRGKMCITSKRRYSDLICPAFQIVLQLCK